MSKVQTLRVFITQRLTAAAEEIFELFERTIAEYEEELRRQRKRTILDAVFKPEVRLHRADVQQLLVRKEEVPPEQQDCSPSRDQEDPPELPHIKEEQEELWSSQEGEQPRGLEEDEITKFTFPPVCMKSEDDDQEIPQSSELHQRHTEKNRDVEHLKTEAYGSCGGSEPARNFKPSSHLHPATHDKTSDSCEIETDDTCDCEESREPESSLHPLQNIDVAVSDNECGSSECVASFGQGGHLQKYNGLQTEMKPFICLVCGKKYSRRETLTNHARLHSEGKRFSCSVCEKTYQWKGQLVRHMRYHTGEKPFSCSVCGARFAQVSYLTSHLRVHTGEKPYTCSVCKVSFGDSGTLYNHKRIHTGEKPFGCSVCKKTFVWKAHVVRHMRIHTGEKPYSCSFCSKGFTQNSTLISHVRVHTGEKPFICSVCSRTFGDRANLRRHLRRHLNVHTAV